MGAKKNGKLNINQNKQSIPAELKFENEIFKQEELPVDETPEVPEETQENLEILVENSPEVPEEIQQPKEPESTYDPLAVIKAAVEADQEKNLVFSPYIPLMKTPVMFSNELPTKEIIVRKWENIGLLEGLTGQIESVDPPEHTPDEKIEVPTFQEVFNPDEVQNIVFSDEISAPAIIHDSVKASVYSPEQGKNNYAFRVVENHRNVDIAPIIQPDVRVGTKTVEELNPTELRTYQRTGVLPQFYY